MDAAAQSGENVVSKRQIDDSASVWIMSGPARDGTAQTVSRDRIIRRERGQGIKHFSCSADHEQDLQL